MKPEQSVYNKLHKFSAKEEPMKVEFAMEDYLSQVEKEFQRGERLAKELEKVIEKIKQEVKPLRDGVYDSAVNIGGIREKAKAEITEIVKQARKLGLDSSDAYKAWTKVNDLSSTYAQKLDRYWQRAKL